MSTTRTPHTPRIPPLPPAEWPPVLRSLLADSRQDGPDRENLFGTLAHHPVLAHAWLSLARVLTHEGTLGHRRRELIVSQLRVAEPLECAGERDAIARLALEIARTPQQGDRRRHAPARGAMA